MQQSTDNPPSDGSEFKGEPFSVQMRTKRKLYSVKQSNWYSPAISCYRDQFHRITNSHLKIPAAPNRSISWKKEEYSWHKVSEYVFGFLHKCRSTVVCSTGLQKHFDHEYAFDSVRIFIPNSLVSLICATGLMEAELREQLSQQCGRGWSTILILFHFCFILDSDFHRSFISISETRNSILCQLTLCFDFALTISPPLEMNGLRFRRQIVVVIQQKGHSDKLRSHFMSLWQKH